jgi:hypothetical protein
VWVRIALYPWVLLNEAAGFDLVRGAIEGGGATVHGSLVKWRRTLM